MVMIYLTHNGIKRKQVFIINGSGGVGKDTFVKMVSEATDNSVLNFSSVDKVKDIARIIGWTGGKTENSFPI